MSAGAGDRDVRAALARKYAALVALRRRRDDGGDAAGGGALRALAAEFPGCLRELDTLGLAELERRAAVCERQAAEAGDDDDGDDVDWMDWIAAYHALMRGALAARAASGDPRARAAAASAAAGLALDEAFVRDVLAPPGGRMAVVIFRALGARFGVPAATISTALFPVRRPSPYSL